MQDRLNEIRSLALKRIKDSDSPEKLKEIQIAVLGKKGELTSIMKTLKDVAPEDRPKVGQMINDARAEIEKNLEEANKKLQEEVRNARLKAEVIDVTLPAKKPVIGHRHPNTIALEEVERIFIGLGYEITEGPEIEKDYYNFEALNIPADHPAKDEQDTFYINGEMLLRTQTSSTQIHAMEAGKPPIRILAPGRVFRADEVDATHSPSFHQIEGLVVDKYITFADLKEPWLSLQKSSSVKIPR